MNVKRKKQKTNGYINVKKTKERKKKERKKNIETLDKPLEEKRKNKSFAEI